MKTAVIFKNNDNLAIPYFLLNTHPLVNTTIKRVKETKISKLSIQPHVDFFRCAAFFLQPPNSTITNSKLLITEPPLTPSHLGMGFYP